jgi:hypothetical protein
MRLTHSSMIMSVMAKTAIGQILDGGIVEAGVDWVLGTHFTFYGGKSQLYLTLSLMGFAYGYR